MPQWTPSQPEIAAFESILDHIETAWRAHYASNALVAMIGEGEDPSDKTEVYPFAFGLMACIVRSSRAVADLTRAGFGVESRPILRSILDQILCLHSLKAHGKNAVHAYGKQLANNYGQLLRASASGFALGAENERYIQKFIALAGGLPSTAEGRAAEGAISSFRAGNENGSFAAAIYQMWLEATPLAKPSMRLADAYVSAEEVGDGIRLNLFLESDNDAVVDARILLATILPSTLLIYADIVEDAELYSIADDLGREMAAVSPATRS